MKTKTIFMLAAMLLMSMGAFAQSTEPLEGDVNNDGTVDVADIVAVIKIMKDGGGAVGEKNCYWYAGTNNGNAVTADNFTDVASQIPESEVPETGSVTANGQYVYFVMPETKHLESLTDGNGSAVEFTSTDIMGYHIYKTVGEISGVINYTVEQSVYYWYVGYNQDAYDNPETFKDYMYTTTTNATPTEYSKDGSNGLDISNTGEHPNYLNMILPSSWDVPTIWDETKQGQILGSILKENIVIKGLKGTYKVWGGDGNGVNDNIIYIN